MSAFENWNGAWHPSGTASGAPDRGSRRCALTSNEKPSCLSAGTYRESLDRYRDTERGPAFKQRFFALLTKIEAGGAVPQTDAIDRFKRDETLDELIAAPHRATSVPTGRWRRSTVCTPTA
jgi:hypothetical protein